MQIEATISRTENTVVNIRPRDFLQKLRNAFVEHIGLPHGAYINKEGTWETWEDTHGSGLYEEYRKAIDYEINIMAAFDTLIKDPAVSK